MKTATFNLDGRKLASLALIPLFLILIGVVTALNIPGSFEDPFALALLNTLFLGIIPIVIAYFTFKVVSRSGSASVFLLGSGVLIFGIGSIAAGWVNPLPGGPNMTVTIHNSCACAGSILIFAGAIIRRPGTKAGAGSVSARMVAAAYTGIFIFVAALSLAAIQGLTPPFFVPGSGPTMLRQVILENAILLFAISSGLFIAGWRRERSDFFFWYSGAFALVAIGLLAVFVQPSVGSITGWIGRFAQYLGFVFALNAILIARKTAAMRGLPLEEVIAGFFMDPEQSYTSLIETATNAIVVFDAEDRVIVWNQAAETMFGYSQDEAIGSNFTQLAVPDEAAGTIKKQFQGNEIPGAGLAVPKPVEITIRRKDGSTFPAELTLSRHKAGGTMVSTCIIRDLTWQKNAELRVRENHKTFSELIEGAPFGIYIIDSQFRIAMMNAGSQEGAFRNVRPLIGRDFNEAMHTLWPDEVAEEIIGHFHHTLETGEPYYSPRFTSPRHDIDLVESYEWELHRMKMPDGQFGVICYYFDSTKLHSAEDKLRRSEESLRLAQETGHIGVWDWDMLTGEVRWTPELEAIYGLEPGSIHTYQDFRDLVHPDDIGRVEKTQADAVGQHKPFEYEFRFRRTGGEVGWVYCRGGALYDEDGQPVRQFGVNLDITDRKQAESALHESERRYSALFNNKINGMAHCRIITDENGRPVDYVILRINEAYERIIGIKKADIEGRRVTDVFPGIKNFAFDYIGVYGKVALEGGEISFEEYFESTGQYLSIYAYCPLPGEFAALFSDVSDRKRAEMALRESDARFRSLAENAPSVLQRFDRQLRVVYLSPLAEKITGMPTEAFIGKTNREVGMPDDLCRLWEKAQNEVFETGQNRDVEFDITTPEGKKTFILRFAPERAADGSVAYILGISTDITDRKRAEVALEQNNENLGALNKELTTTQEELRERNEALLRSEHELAVKNAQLQALFDYSSASLVLFDAKKPYTVLAHNAYYQKLWAEPFRSIGMVGKNLYDYVPGAEVSGVIAIYDEVVATRKARTLINFPYDGMDRGRTYWNWHLSPVIQDGEIVALAHLGIDVTNEVTARMKVEETLAALVVSEQRFRELAEKAGSIILRFDAGGRITYFNEFAEQFFGYSRNEILGKPAVGTIIPATDSAGKDLDFMVRDIVANPDLYANNENENIRKTGERVWVRWTNKPVFNPDGTVREFTTIGTDITDRKRAEMDLVHREKQLSDALREKEILLSEIHHRVKNNLTAFISLLSLEGSTEETEAGRELKKDLQNRARSMALIHETLYRTHQFSSVDMDAYLTPLVDQVINSYSSAKSIRTVVDAKGVTLDLGRATPTGLIVSELVINSLKHAFPNDACRADQATPCAISVRIIKENGSYTMIVSDNGIGMPAGFYPLTAKTLGLKLVTFLAKHQMRATIKVNSEKGTEFIFRFDE